MQQAGRSPPDDRKENLLNLYALHAAREKAAFAAHLYSGGIERAHEFRYQSPALWEAPSKAPANATASSPTPSSISIGALVNAFLAEQMAGVAERTLVKNTWQLGIAAQFFGPNTPAASISKAQVREFRSMLTKLPCHFSKRFAGMPLSEVIALPLSVREPLLKPSTINPYLSSLTQLYRWATSLGHVADNPAEMMGVKDKEKAKDKRHPFNKDQLDKIFQQPLFVGHKAGHWKCPGPVIERGARFWAPVIALLSGMRRGEIFALTPEHIVCRGDFYLFDIREAKTDSGVRQVPVHRLLLELGLLDFVKALEPSQPIFGDMTGDALGKFFCRFLRAAGIKTSKLTYHSFRHTFFDAARAARMPKELMRAIVGHSDGSVTDSYGSGYPVEVLNEAMQQIGFWGLQLAHLRRGTE